MKLFIILLLVAGAGALAVASVLFRSEGATRLLKQLRLAAFALAPFLMELAILLCAQHAEHTPLAPP